jgi:hypothetical protein
MAVTLVDQRRSLMDIWANWLGQIGWPLEAVLVISNGAVSCGATINGASAGIAGIQAAGT